MLTRAVSSAEEHRPYKARATGSIPVPPILVIIARCFGIRGTNGDHLPKRFGGWCPFWCPFGCGPIEPLHGFVQLPGREVCVALGHARRAVAEQIADVLDADPRPAEPGRARVSACHPQARFRSCSGTPRSS